MTLQASETYKKYCRTYKSSINLRSIYFSQNRLHGYKTPMLGKASGYKQRLLVEKFVKSPFLVSNKNTSEPASTTGTQANVSKH